MSPTAATPETIPPFVDCAWLREHRDDVLVADVRWYGGGSSGRAAYDGGHIPGAVHVDVDVHLSGDAGSRGLNPLPDPEAFAHAMSALGIGDDSTVVAYDDAGGVIAARLVWMLRALGKRAALLDGGISAWTGELETDPAQPAPATFTAIPWPAESTVEVDDVDRWSGVVVDARNADRFDGSLQAPIDPQAGHIPGAVNVPCRENLDSAGRVRPAAEVREAFAKAGIQNGAAVVSYCGSGIAACHTLLTLEHAELGRGRLYPGGWSEYAADPQRVAEK
ncbi:sulfurtransferase [Saccharopolyspora sp. WRP15-2]|uniref:Sulfurtransferase n=1 Tax=Saccharopolyspora oryzae TaxID=2997343 RepID=A0ABT4VAJ7_9PSEU|nr:sulfurtransferase [Saccharopolyspora oryzae]MDA3630985.1 sulfurtransferase [Saccharopolyspora oryzae]